MGKQRKQYQASFKSKVALEAIKGVRTANEIGTHYGVHPTQVALWKKQALEHLRDAFSDGRKRQERAEEELQSELYQQIPQIQKKNPKAQLARVADGNIRPWNGAMLCERNPNLQFQSTMG